MSSRYNLRSRRRPPIHNDGDERLPRTKIGIRPPKTPSVAGAPQPSRLVAIILAAALLSYCFGRYFQSTHCPPPPPPPPPPVCPAPPIFPKADGFDWILQLPNLCDSLSGPGADPWALFGVAPNLTSSWQNPLAPNGTESKACLWAVRRGYRRVRALWHPDRVATGSSSDERESGPTAPSQPKSTPGLRAMFNLSERQLGIVAAVIDDLYTKSKFRCLKNEQKSRYLDVLADNEDLDIDDMTDDPLPPPKSPDAAMDMHDSDYLSLYLLAERLGQPFHLIAHSFRQLRRAGVWLSDLLHDDFLGFEDFEGWRKKGEEEWRKKAKDEYARLSLRQWHLARLMGNPRLRHGLGPEWEREDKEPKKHESLKEEEERQER